MTKTIKNNGLALALLSTICFSFMGVSAKILSDIPTFQLIFFRSAVGIIMSLPWLKMDRMAKARDHKIPLAIRSIGGAIAFLCFIYAIQKLPMVTAYIFAYLSPIITALVAPLVIRETWNPKLAVIIPISFGGMVLILMERFAPTQATAVPLHTLGTVAGLTSSIALAAAFLSLKHLRQHLDSMTIIIFFYLAMAIMSAPSLWLHPLPSGTSTWAWIVIMALSGTLAQLLHTFAYRFDSASRIAAMKYFGVLFASIWGIFLFAEIPSLMTIIGAILIVGGGLLLQFWDKKGIHPTRTI